MINNQDHRTNFCLLSFLSFIMGDCFIVISYYAYPDENSELRGFLFFFLELIWRIVILFSQLLSDFVFEFQECGLPAYGIEASSLNQWTFNMRS